MLISLFFPRRTGIYWTESSPEYGDKTGNQLSHLTHQEIPYTATEHGEEIPYYLAPYRHVKKPGEDEVNRIRAHEGLMGTLHEALGETWKTD